MERTRLWVARDGPRYFLIPPSGTLPTGDLRLTSLEGNCIAIAADAGTPFEVTEAQARRWAKNELGLALEELRRGADEKLAALRARLDAMERAPIRPGARATRDLGPALLELAKGLPGVIARSLSKDPDRVGAAREAMAALQRRLHEAGIDLDERFTGFPDRLARLREEVERERAAARAGREPKKPGEGL